MTPARTSFVLILLPALLAPFMLFAQSQGLADCTASGADSKSAGVQASSYVPVDDARVARNTGLIAYAICDLKKIVVAARVQATSKLSADALAQFQQGRPVYDVNNTIVGRKPLYPVNIAEDKLDTRGKSVIRSLQNGALSSVNPGFQGLVNRAIAQSYMAATYQSGKNLACGYNGDISVIQRNPTASFSWSAFQAEADPDCIPWFSYYNANEAVLGQADAEVNDMMTQLGWGSGIYPIQHRDANGNLITDVPGAVVLSNELMFLQSGFRQQEQADDVGEIVNGLYAGLATQITTSNQGLAALTNAGTNGQSALQQLGSQVQAGTVTALANNSIGLLQAALVREQEYRQTLQSIGGAAGQGVGTLRQKENACWAIIAFNDQPGKHVCNAAPTGSSCTAADGTQLTIATSTNFSDAVVSARFGSTAVDAQAGVASVTSIITLIQQLMAAMSGSGSSQTQAIQQANQLLNGGLNGVRLHSDSDLSRLKLLQQTVSTQIGASSGSGIIADTVAIWTGVGSDGSGNAAWDGSTSPGTGWCNINNPATIDAWKQKWKR